jgi:acyl-coenzyme A synthetase/AMP-(fatty) acid ligase
MSVSPLISHRSHASVFAYRDGAPILVEQFMHDVESLARQLPDSHYILNLCADRYRFAVGFAAALLRGQTSLLPPNYTASFVEHLGLSYPDLYCLADGEVNFPGVAVLHYPILPETDNQPRAIPAIQSAQRAALVFTSGSTGHPVAHAKSWGSLCKGATAEAASLHIVPDSGMAILGTVPAQHMYGLESSMLLAMHNGLALVAERPFYPADICAQLAALPQPRCLITTPIHLRTLLSEAEQLPAVEFVLCATAHLSVALATEAEARFSAPLYEIYGCTETGMVASRRTTQGAAWHLLREVELRQDEHGSRMRGGHVEIEAPLSDVIERGPDRTFTLLGRTADMVNIAGKRTSLASLNHILNEIPGVRDGAFFMPDDSDGSMQRTLAFVVAPGMSRADILRTLRNSVDAVFLPRPLYLVDALPRNSTGKLSRVALIQLLERCAKK